MNDTHQGGCTPAPYVRPSEHGNNIWLALPGAPTSLLLTKGEARKLFRELEEVV